jgi:hypothetical protein
MRMWLIGAGKTGCAVLRQLQKNVNLEIIVSDTQERPQAVKEGLIDQIDFVQRVTPININEVAKRIRPDLILIATGSGIHSYAHLAGGVAMADALNYEIATASDYPCLVISRSNLT